MAERVAQIASHISDPKGLLAGQTAIITGSGQGIGAEAARLFAQEGAKVVVCDVDSDMAQSVVNEIVASGGQAIAVSGDITDRDYISQLVQRAAQFGGGEIHIIVNNAGFTWDGVVHKMTDKQWVAMENIHGLHGNIGQSNYAFFKAGVSGLMKTVAKEWGPAFNVRANTVAFGYIETRLTQAKEIGTFITGPGGEEIQLGVPGRNGKSSFEDIPLRRPGSAHDAAKVILAVCSPLFSYVTGQVISVTGGRNM
ncbi:short-chain dehydrogenase [Fusarium tjaetaba]|uniref:3-oxoacyl-[acyl-carrier-protein] reductase n=1 Tax=Fusarium tjaetaba TaxID=1567544 RepID=A0A8H5S9I9_9HYPO|nr:short-chain dehydrogenase [Fusarium tjaetaba]KAF5646964.1 short-chain dehydrogenase [Fusarium tjaetaba]